MNFSYAVLILGLVTVATGSQEARVVGGTDAPEGKYPYQAVFINRDELWGGGSIINEYFILTSASCIYDIPTTDLKVMYGTNLFNDSKATWHEVDETIVHKKYLPGVHQFDLGLVKLKEKIVFDEKVQPIELASNNIDGVFPAVATGFGSDRVGGPMSKTLKQVFVNTTSYAKCSMQWIFLEKVTPEHICTAPKLGKGICIGDSGVALVADKVQVGIASFGRLCAKGYPDVYTRVSSFFDWINKNSQY